MARDSWLQGWGGLGARCAGNTRPHANGAIQRWWRVWLGTSRPEAPGQPLHQRSSRRSSTTAPPDPTLSNSCASIHYWPAAPKPGAHSWWRIYIYTQIWSYIYYILFQLYTFPSPFNCLFLLSYFQFIYIYMYIYIYVYTCIYMYTYFSLFEYFVYIIYLIDF